MLSTPDPAIPFEFGGNSYANRAIGAGINLGDRPKIAPFDAVYDLNQSPTGDPNCVGGNHRLSFGRSVERDEASDFGTGWPVAVTDDDQLLDPYAFHWHEWSEYLHLLQFCPVPILFWYDRNVGAASLHHLLVGPKVVPPAKPRRPDDNSPAP